MMGGGKTEMGSSREKSLVLSALSLVYFEKDGATPSPTIGKMTQH